MFLSRKKNEEVVLIVDIGNDSVGASLSLLSDVATPKILYSFRSNITWHTSPENSRFVSEISKTLEQVMKDISQNGLRFIPRGPLGRVQIHRSHIIFSAPWYSCETKVLKVTHPSPVIMTQELIVSLFKNEIEKFTEEAQSRARSKISQNLQVAERRVIRTKLNGYETSDPFSKKASDVELTVFISLVSKDILVAVQKVINSYFHILRTDISSFPLAAFTVFSASMPKTRDFLIVDVRGEMTDISLICDGLLMDNISFPQGKNALVRTLSTGLKQSIHTSLSSLKMISQGHGGDKLLNNVFKLTETFKTVWSDSYIKSLRDVLRNKSLPQAVLLIGDVEMGIFFEDIFKQVKKGTVVHFLRKSDLHRYVHVEPAFSDTVLGLETAFVDQLAH